MAKRPTVPKFGTWDSDNVGYTVYFDKVRENKGATAPPLQRPFNPNDPEDGPMMAVPPPSSRPSTAAGHRDLDPPSRQSHRRVGSNSSVASDPGGGRGAEQSKFAPPPQYHRRPGPQQPPHHHPPPATHGGGGGGGQRTSQAPRQHNRQRPSAVPKFGVWDEQSAASAAQGFTVQFENVKRHREVARAGVPDVPRAPPEPPKGAGARRSHHRDGPFFSKMFGCFLPTVRD